MRTKGFFASAFAVAPLIVFVAMLLSGCDHPVASDVLQGRWIAGGTMGPTLEFSNGRFTRTLPGGIVQAGTYSTDGRHVTFHRRGHTPETLWFSLAFPALTMGEVGSESGRKYFHDSPREPNVEDLDGIFNLEGTWFGFRGVGTTGMSMPIVFGAVEHQRGSRWAMEGEYLQRTFRRGEFTVSARNTPDAGRMTMRITHIHGGDLYAFVNYRLHVHLTALFNIDQMRYPEEYGDWPWFTPEEARRFFVDAVVNAAGHLAWEQQIMSAKTAFFAGVDAASVYDYTLQDDVDIYDIVGNRVEGRSLLTIRTDTGGILTFARGSAGEGGGGVSWSLDEDYEYVIGYGIRLRDFALGKDWAVPRSQFSTSEVQ